MNDNIILELEGVCKKFKDNDGKLFKAVNNVNLKLAQGECIGIVGESGCGKSTLARIISRLVDTSEGKIVFKGEDAAVLRGKSLKTYYKSIQMIFQDPLSTFSPRMKIGTYLIEPFINFNIMNRKQSCKYVEEMLSMVGLNKDYAHRYPSELSGGQLQRVVIARAIGLKPDIIVCDECTSALDVSIQQQIVNLLLELRKQTNFSNIFITHDLALAESICDRIYVMYLGEIVEVIESQNIIKDAKHPYTKMLLNSVFSVKEFNKKIEAVDAILCI
ncbi:ATP-binding cassette domain-containing protein [Petroclostridium sp. X23]|uniref:ABC transporter ATP-binding protein n=1 Tax=Petroclostridium sp. X23 TaxID=3045146 RepID=UPI0024AE0306|nr:ATP-binding cassette domain-containing protein [Petroclostridium sp. X23]WHH58675.1 ATP-binding cassette domain-containing protein [Petroclostridium sp. X23]